MIIHVQFSIAQMFAKCFLRGVQRDLRQQESRLYDPGKRPGSRHLWAKNIALDVQTRHCITHFCM